MKEGATGLAHLPSQPGLVLLVEKVLDNISH